MQIAKTVIILSRESLQEAGGDLEIFSQKVNITIPYQVIDGGEVCEALRKEGVDEEDVEYAFGAVREALNRLSIGRFINRVKE